MGLAIVIGAEHQLRRSMHNASTSSSSRAFRYPAPPGLPLLIDLFLCLVTIGLCLFQHDLLLGNIGFQLFHRQLLLLCSGQHRNTQRQRQQNAGKDDSRGCTLHFINSDHSRSGCARWYHARRARPPAHARHDGLHTDATILPIRYFRPTNRANGTHGFARSRPVGARNATGHHRYRRTTALTGAFCHSQNTRFADGTVLLDHRCRHT